MFVKWGEITIGKQRRGDQSLRTHSCEESRMKLTTSVVASFQDVTVSEARFRVDRFRYTATCIPTAKTPPSYDI